LTGLEELQYIDYLKRRVEEQGYYIRELESALSGVSGIRYDADKVQTSVKGDRLIDGFAKIEKEQQKLKKLTERWMRWKIRCMDRIHRMKVTDHQKLLYLVYIEGKGLKEASVDMCWSYGYTRNQHVLAVKEYSQIKM